MLNRSDVHCGRYNQIAIRFLAVMSLVMRGIEADCCRFVTASLNHSLCSFGL